MSPPMPMLLSTSRPVPQRPSAGRRSAIRRWRARPPRRRARSHREPQTCRCPGPTGPNGSARPPSDPDRNRGRLRAARSGRPPFSPLGSASPHQRATSRPSGAAPERDTIAWPEKTRSNIRSAAAGAGRRQAAMSSGELQPRIAAGNRSASAGRSTSRSGGSSRRGAPVRPVGPAGRRPYGRWTSGSPANRPHAGHRARPIAQKPPSSLSPRTASAPSQSTSRWAVVTCGVSIPISRLGPADGLVCTATKAAASRSFRVPGLLDNLELASPAARVSVPGHDLPLRAARPHGTDRVLDRTAGQGGGLVRGELSVQPRLHPPGHEAPWPTGSRSPRGRCHSRKVIG